MSENLSAELRGAYEQAIYAVITELAAAGELPLRIGVLSPELDQLLQQHNAQTAVFITGSNPRSEQRAAAENQQRHMLIHARIVAAGYAYLPGEARDPTGVWPTEHSWVVFDMEAEVATELAAQFGQHAYVWLQIGVPPRLVYVAGS
jgi:hypothetical protein